ncbi:MAG: S26 family signal peptidase [Flavobacteriales bacterium]
MIPWILLILLLIVYSLTLPMLLVRAGRSATLGYVPLANFVPFLKMIKRPWWWTLLLLCPGVNLLVLIIMNVELGIAFGKRSITEQWLFGALPWLALPKLAYKEKEVKFIGPRDWTGKKKSFMREWGEALVFAVIAASVIRTFFIEAFTIPTPSMEKTNLVGDYLFVSKVSYGAKIPQTPMSIPFVHNAIPGGLTNSYVGWFSLPYFRLPGLGSVERYDPVVFNFPHGDTVIVDMTLSTHDYYRFLRDEAMHIAKNNITEFEKDKSKYMQAARKNLGQKNQIHSLMKGGVYKTNGLKTRPMDKRDNYVKRCMGLPGDNLKIVGRQVFINDAPAVNPDNLMFSYKFTVSDRGALKKIYDAYKVNMGDRHPLKDESLKYGKDTLGRPYYWSSFTWNDFQQLTQDPTVLGMEPTLDEPEDAMALFPNSNAYPYNTWTRDNYGPVHIPAKGETINLTIENIEFYRRVINVYEGNEWREAGGKVYINGVETSTYTFKQNYYWMMGDNRHQSADSRYWGFVPEDHIVGKPVFTWFSKEDKEYQPGGEYRWSRMFRFVK